MGCSVAKAAIAQGAGELNGFSYSTKILKSRTGTRPLLAFGSRRPRVTFLLLAVALLSSIVHSARAATYYVDYAQGSDTNAGLSKVNPWKHAPGDMNAGGLPKAAVLLPGDTVIFRGGVEYIGAITAIGSGSAGNYITYDGNSDGTWGTGKTRINSDYQYYHAFVVSNKQHIIIKNFDIFNYKNTTFGTQKVDRGGITQLVTYSGSGSNSDVGAIKLLSAVDVIIRDCIIHEAEHWSDRSVPGAEADGDDLTTYRVPSDQAAISLDKADTVLIQNCEFFATGGDVIFTVAPKNVTIINNNFGGINRGTKAGWFSVAIRFYKTVNFLIRGNTFHDGWQYQGDDAAGQRSHAGDWLHIYGVDDIQTCHHLTIEGNFFYNDHTFLTKRGTAIVYPSGYCHDIWIRNNIFVNQNFGHGAVFLRGRTYNIFVHNNTFVNSNLATAVDFGDSTGPRIEVYNNIFVSFSASRAATLVYAPGQNIPANLDYNIYYKPYDAAQQVVRLGSVYYTLAEWKTGRAQDLNSIAADPMLVNITPAGASGNGDYRLSVSSGAINAGTALTGFNTDKAGTSRPQGSGWDIGAYEYASTPSPSLSPPTALAVTTDQQ
jgi:hypothetical protein